MLVVVSLVAILATMVVVFLPTVNERQNTTRAADRLQGWLLAAKMWAKRDGVPTGIRLQPGAVLPAPGPSANTNWVTDLQYIQQPGTTLSMGTTQPNALPQDSYRVTDPNPTIGFIPITISQQAGAGPYNVVDLAYPTGVSTPPPDFSGGLASLPMINLNQWAVQAGDYLETPTGANTFYRIASVSSATELVLYTVTNPNPPNAIIGGAPTPGVPAPGTTDYRIHRAPRILAGEATLQLANGVAIDMGFSIGLSLSASPTLPFDILFAPSGSVIGPAAVNDTIALWVRDVTKPGLQGEMTLITIYCRTGFIAAQAVNTLNTSTATAVAAPPNTFALSNVAGITPFVTYLVLDATGTNPETQLVTSVSGNNVTVANVVSTHTSPFTVIIDPFSYIRDGRSGGL